MTPRAETPRCGVLLRIYPPRSCRREILPYWASGSFTMAGFDSQAGERRARLHHQRITRVLPTVLALLLAAGWAWREVAFARTNAELLRSSTVTLSQVPMNDFLDQGKATGKIGFYFRGDSPASTKFVTGRFVLDPGK